MEILVKALSYYSVTSYTIFYDICVTQKGWIVIFASVFRATIYMTKILKFLSNTTLAN